MNWRRTLLIVQAALWLSATLFAGTVNYKYDDAGRLTNVSYADGTVIAYS
jgi:YD repeat-containing protein